MLATAARACEPARREPGSLLGDPRRRRQLRRRHLVPVPAAPGRHGRRRPDALAARARRAEVLRWYREFLPHAPRELNGFFAFHDGAAGPALPRGAAPAARCAASCGATSGSEEDGATAIAPLLDALPEPLMHGVGPMPHPALQGAFDALYPRRRPVVLARRLRERDPDEAVEHARAASARRCRRCSRRCTCTRSTARRTTSASADTPWAYRDANWAPVYRRRRSRSGERRRDHAAGRIDYLEALHPFSAGGAYVNMMMDEGEERVRATYRDNYDRLARDQGRRTTRRTCSASTRTSNRRGKDVETRVTERDQDAIELFLNEPEIRAWLEPDDHGDNDDEPPRRSDDLLVRPLRHGEVRAVLGVFERLSDRSRRAAVQRAEAVSHASGAPAARVGRR